MKESILEKISVLVTKGIESEAECVYLLAQIRKYIEQQHIDGYWNLRMCANWTLHSQLDNTTVQVFLNELNDFLIDAEARQDYYLSYHSALKNKLSFVTSLQNELSDFLNSIGIDSSICTENAKFRNLLRIFGCVIEDTPLVCKPKSPLSHLSEVSFSRRQSVFQDLQPLSLYWHIKNGAKTVLRIHSNIVSIPIASLEIYTETFSFVTNDRD